MYQVYVKCDHVSPADVKMSRANEIAVWHNEADAPAMYIHICNSCKAVMGNRFASDAQLDEN